MADSINTARAKALVASKSFWTNVILALVVYLNKVPASFQPFVPYILAGVNVLLTFLNQNTTAAPPAA